MKWRRKLALRLDGVPRSPKQADAALKLLAALRRIGWRASVERGYAVDVAGNPLPWLSYAAIEWLDAMVRAHHTVFEYGCGQSTQWFAARCGRVVSVEHDLAWADRVRDTAPPSCEVRHRPIGNGYVEAIAEDATVYDIVVVDGRLRPEALALAPAHLRHDGLIVLDNADRPDYWDAIRSLQTLGFRRIDFAGPGPALTNFTTTSVLSRDLNAWAPGDVRPTDWGRAVANEPRSWVPGRPAD